MLVHDIHCICISNTGTIGLIDTWYQTFLYGRIIIDHNEVKILYYRFDRYIVSNVPVWKNIDHNEVKS